MHRLMAAILVMMGVAAAVPSFVGNMGTLEGSTKQPQKNVMDDVKTVSQSTPSGQVRLKPDARGHYVADFKMNGRVVTALVDTGASSVAINKSTARKLGLNVTANDFIHEATTANGKTKMAIATIREIQIGRILVRDVEAAVLEDKALEGTLLGMSFLRQLDGFTVTDGDLILKQ